MPGYTKDNRAVCVEYSEEEDEEYVAFSYFDATEHKNIYTSTKATEQSARPAPYFYDSTPDTQCKTFQ